MFMESERPAVKNLTTQAKEQLKPDLMRPVAKGQLAPYFIRLAA